MRLLVVASVPGAKLQVSVGLGHVVQGVREVGVGFARRLREDQPCQVGAAAEVGGRGGEQGGQVEAAAGPEGLTLVPLLSVVYRVGRFVGQKHTQPPAEAERENCIISSYLLGNRLEGVMVPRGGWGRNSEGVERQERKTERQMALKKGAQTVRENYNSKKWSARGQVRRHWVNDQSQIEREKERLTESRKTARSRARETEMRCKVRSPDQQATEHVAVELLWRHVNEMQERETACHRATCKTFGTPVHRVSSQIIPFKPNKNHCSRFKSDLCF